MIYCNNIRKQLYILELTTATTTLAPALLDTSVCASGGDGAGT